IRVEPASQVYHVGGGSLPQGDARKAYFNFRNSLLVLYKNLTPAEWRKVLPLRCALDTFAALRALVSGRPAEAWAVIRAYAHAHRMKKGYSNQARPTTIILPSYRGSIVIDYFIRNRRKFSELPPSKFTQAEARRGPQTSLEEGPSR
ncbi:MAG: glycosyltransferase family 2 protein, partial [Rhodothermales bacterium]